MTDVNFDTGSHSLFLVQDTTNFNTSSMYLDLQINFYITQLRNQLPTTFHNIQLFDVVYL